MVHCKKGILLWGAIHQTSGLDVAWGGSHRMWPCTGPGWPLVPHLTKSHVYSGSVNVKGCFPTVLFITKPLHPAAPVCSPLVEYENELMIYFTLDLHPSSKSGCKIAFNNPTYIYTWGAAVFSRMKSSHRHWEEQLFSTASDYSNATVYFTLLNITFNRRCNRFFPWVLSADRFISSQYFIHGLDYTACIKRWTTHRSCF